MAITLNLDPETERRLRERAAERGRTLETYLEHLAEEQCQAKESATAASSEASSTVEFEHQLDALSDGLPDLPPLPADLSRTDLYESHD